jgi:hypothetical protein
MTNQSLFGGARFMSESSFRHENYLRNDRQTRDIIKGTSGYRKEKAGCRTAVLFVSFLVKLIFRCGRRPGCDFCGENLKNGRDDKPADICERVIR